MDFKDRVKKAMEKHHGKLIKKKRVSKGPNKRPEKEVERACANWLTRNEFSFNIVESKAVYSRAAGRYLSGQTDPGVSDCNGVHGPTGISVFIEFKAPGRGCKLRPAQEQFLLTKISFNAFAVVVDSAEMLATRWSAFSLLRNTSLEQAREYLKNIILSQSRASEEPFHLLDDNQE